VDSTIVVAITGLAGAILAVVGTLWGPTLQAKQTAEIARDARFDEQRTALYLDAITFAEDLSARLDRYSDPMASASAHPANVARRGDIAARMQALAPKAVLDAWTNIAEADSDLAYRVDQDQSLREGNMLDGRDPLVTGTVTAVEALRAAVRRATGADS
jgi:hypothetical protein